jgi:quercetin dioxygenase-like cupin family protein
MTHPLPPFMKRRHEVLQKIHTLLLSDTKRIGELFDFNKTVHADLDLSWIDPIFQEKEIGSSKEYQVVIATVKAGQTSDAHMHEVGASSFIVLGTKANFPEPTNLIYRTGTLHFPSGDATIDKEVNLKEGDELDIPSYQIHQFENKSDKDAYVLIVTHPIISVEKDHEDIHFVLKK